MKRHSPYNYSFNNPIRFVDPDGMLPEDRSHRTEEQILAAEADRAVSNQMAFQQSLNRTQDDPPGWLQKMLSLFGYGTKAPRDEEEASEQSDRRAALLSSNAKVEENMKIAEDIPIAGGLLKISKGATGTFAGGKDYGSVVSGGGDVLFDIAGGSIVKNGIKVMSKDVLGHIFRNAAGHVNPSTVESMGRYIKLFENVAGDAKNVNSAVLSNYQRGAGGFQGFTQIFKNGKQVWVQTFNGKIINAGVNALPK